MSPTPPMGRVHPAEAPRPCRSKGEVAVWEALRKQLPEGWRAWHSLQVRDAKGYLGEGDFVLAHPERGMVVLEVKGGKLELVDGRWFQNGKPLDKAPLEQGLGFQAKLLRRLADFGVSPPTWGVGAVFPDVEFDATPTQDVLAGAILGKVQLQWLDRAFEPFVARVLPKPRGGKGDWIAVLHRLWGERWVPALSLGTRARLEAERHFMLDDAQAAALGGLAENDRVLIEGGAGSGKTLLAAEAARRHAAEGKRVLLLCFTAPLKRWLAARLAGTGVEVETVSGLARGIAERAGTAPAAGDLTSSEYWRAVTERAVEHAEAAWDAVIVDEGQDLTFEAWCLVEAIARGKRLWVLHDPSQGFWSDRRPPRELFDVTFKLPRGKRCPAGIEALAARYAGRPGDDAAIPPAVEDGTLRFVPCADPARAAEAVGAEVDRLLAQGLALSDIGVVSLRGQTGEGVLQRESLGVHAFVPADDPAAEGKLVADTFLRWKGLERAAIVVATDGAEDRPNFGTRMHIALTRALVAARIVGSPPSAGQGAWPGLPV